MLALRHRRSRSKPSPHPTPPAHGGGLVVTAIYINHVVSHLAGCLGAHTWHTSALLPVDGPAARLSSCSSSCSSSSRSFSGLGLTPTDMKNCTAPHHCVNCARVAANGATKHGDGVAYLPGVLVVAHKPLRGWWQLVMLELQHMLGHSAAGCSCRAHG
jgi:hypothetical protein